MINITNTGTDKLQVITGTTVSGMDVLANWMDYNGTTVTPGRSLTSITTAATTDITATPGASTTRNVKSLHIRNKDTTVSTSVLVQFNANSTVYELYKITLAAGEALEYVEGVGFFKLSAINAVITSNANTADVTANAADTYLTGSSLQLAGKLQAGVILRFRGTMTKTAAGVATPIFNIRVGANQSTADTSVGALTFLAQTAATDTGWFEAEAIVRTYSASGVIQCAAAFHHINTTTGLANAAQVQEQKATSGSIDLTGATVYIGLSCNPGASGVWTFQTVSVTAHGVTN